RQLPAEKHASVLHPVAPKPSINRIDDNRLAHASQVARSQHVKHFSPNQPQYSQLAAAPRPMPVPPQQRRSAIPAVPRVEQTEEDMFESAIAHATSHEQKMPKTRMSWKRRLANTGAIMLALVVIGVFVAYLNLPTI